MADTQARATSPARIEQVTIGNFRSLQQVEFKGITPLTVLLGANGSGKSTFFDVFAFLSDCFSEGLRRAVDKRGKFSDLRSRGQTGPITFEVAYREGGQIGGVRPGLVRYHLAIDEAEGRPVVASEWMHWKRGSFGKPFRFLDYRFGLGSVISGELPEQDDTRRDLPLAAPDVLAVSTLGQLADNPRVRSLRDFIVGWHLSYLSTSDTRVVPEAGPQEHLSRTGNNLANVIQYFSERHPMVLERVFTALRRRIPKLESVQPVSLPTGHLLLTVKDAPFAEGVQARYVSDGTLKMLAYLIQLNDPSPPPFLGIEEPENFLHPRLLRELAEECEVAARRMQMVVTTHSPFFIDALTPAQVWALRRNAMGYTEAVRASQMAGVPEQIAAGATLGQLWTEGFFEAGNP
ncbi:AAA family ATPase [Sphingomonas sp. CFBP 13720]|uniref:AAA family ATPase n=1 Tax=Sphingomonas sp. CFBP 13720 TaxID=2775302 RepID=UPI0017843D0A|nr:AAA family ATPase [Sphingomonas sp. CFBP 13720]MBD8679301.1 AAA family ATPase [Sphingomonas sp. CFBP 13720]